MNIKIKEVIKECNNKQNSEQRHNSIEQKQTLYKVKPTERTKNVSH